MQKEQKKAIYANYAVLSVLWAFTFTTIVFTLFGWIATVSFIAMATLSVFFLETINYIEHYGLKRKLMENGEYEKVNIKHSWNAAHRFTNYLLFKLQRHSDHH